MPGQSTMGRQEGQAGEMRGIGGLRPPKPATHIAIMFHHRIAAMCVCVGALVARLTLVGVEFRRDSDAIFAPDEIWVRLRSDELPTERVSCLGAVRNMESCRGRTYARSITQGAG